MVAIETLAISFGHLRLDGVTDHVVADLSPHPNHSQSGLGGWLIDFKSVHIWKTTTALMLANKFRNPWEIFNLYHGILPSSPFTGWAFDAIINRLFTNGG